ncbi:hypothetical protein MMK47_003886 [Citrobacter koseri]
MRSIFSHIMYIKNKLHGAKVH